MLVTVATVPRATCLVDSRKDEVNARLKQSLTSNKKGYADIATSSVTAEDLVLDNTSSLYRKGFAHAEFVYNKGQTLIVVYATGMWEKPFVCTDEDRLKVMKDYEVVSSTATGVVIMQRKPPPAD